MEERSLRHVLIRDCAASNAVLLDTSSLLHSHEILLGINDSDLRRIRQAINRDACTPSVMAALHFVQSVIVHELIVVDGLVLEGDEPAKVVAKLFAGAIKKLALNMADRGRLGNEVETNLKGLLKLSKRRDSEPSRMALGLDAQEMGLYRRHRRDMPSWMLNSASSKHRVLFYTALARQAGIPYAPHPARCALVNAWAQIQDRAVAQSSVATDAIDYFSRAMHGQSARVRATFTGYQVSMAVPPVAQYVFATTECAKDILPRINDIRNSANARRFRRWCQGLQAALQGGFPTLGESNKLLSQLQKACDIWSRDVREQVRYKTRELTLGAQAGVAITAGASSAWSVKDLVLFDLFGQLRELRFLNDLVSARLR